MPSYRIRRTEDFERDVGNHLARHYPAGKKGRASRRDFQERLGKVVDDIATDPRRHEDEPWPSDPPPGWEFRKARFFLPRLKNDARRARLPYLVNHDTKEVALVWFYTHAEFTERPSDAALGARVSAALRLDADN